MPPCPIIMLAARCEILAHQPIGDEQGVNEDNINQSDNFILIAKIKIKIF